MADWMYVQENPAEQLAQLHFFSLVKHQAGGDIPFRITIKEFASPPPGQRLRFFAEADKPVNQKTASFIPCGWGNTLFNALGDCMRLIRQFPYEEEEQSQSQSRSA
jgi:hypothetical protein